jgi:hypothetical protein
MLDGLAQVFNRLTDFAPTTPESLFRVTSSFVFEAFKPAEQRQDDS